MFPMNKILSVPQEQIKFDEPQINCLLPVQKVLAEYVKCHYVACYFI